MGAKAKRQALATALQTNLPSGWAVYPSPPDSIVAQSAVISPRSPYITPVSSGYDEVNLQITLLVNVAAGAIAHDILDDAIDAVRTDVISAGNVIWEGVSDIGIVEEVGGADYIAAAINVTMI